MKKLVVSILSPQHLLCLHSTVLLWKRSLRGEFERPLILLPTLQIAQRLALSGPKTFLAPQRAAFPAEAYAHEGV